MVILEQVAAARTSPWLRLLEQPDHVLRSYNAMDVEQTWKAAEHLERDMWTLGVRPCHDLMLELALPAYRMQERGLLVDQDRRDQLRARVMEALDARAEAVKAVFEERMGLQMEAVRHLGNVLRNLVNRRARGIRRRSLFNPRSKLHVARLLQELGMRWSATTAELLRPQLDLRVLGLLRRTYPQHESLLQALWEYAKLEKLRADWLDDGMAADPSGRRKGHRLLCRDQRLRASVRVCGTQSGRFSESEREWCAPCQEPRHGRNRQNLPKADDAFTSEVAPIRSMVVAEPGHVLVRCDYKCLEAWIAARLSNDLEFLARLESGDIHSANARDLFGLAGSVDPNERRMAKIFLFGGVLYKGGTDTLQASFEKAGLFIKLTVLDRWLARWKMRHQTFVRWQADMVQRALRQTPARARTALGRQRLFWGPPKSWARDCLAHTISGTGADYTNHALAALDRAGVSVLLHEHDGLLVTCPTEAADRTALAMLEAFEQDRGLGVFKAEVTLGTNLHEMCPWHPSGTDEKRVECPGSPS